MTCSCEALERALRELRSENARLQDRLDLFRDANEAAEFRIVELREDMDRFRAQIEALAEAFAQMGSHHDSATDAYEYVKWALKEVLDEPEEEKNP